MAASLAANATQAQALAYLNAEYGGYRYANAAKTPYNGMTAAQVYAYLARQDAGQATATPYNLAVVTSDLMLSSGFASAVGTGATEGGDLTGESAIGIASTDYGDSLTSLLGALTSEGTWLRVAKVVVGSAMIIVGLAKLTGTGKAATKAAKGAALA